MREYLEFKENNVNYSHDTGTLKTLLKSMGDNTTVMLETNRRWLNLTTNILAGMDTV